MTNLWRNTRYAMRQLAKSKGFTITAVITLALGVGANTAIFTTVYATILAPMPYPEPDQLVMVWSKIQTFRNGVSAGDFDDWRNQSTAFQYLNAWTGGSFNLATKDQPEYVEGQKTTPGFYKMSERRNSAGDDWTWTWADRRLLRREGDAQHFVRSWFDRFHRSWTGGRGAVQCSVAG